MTYHIEIIQPGIFKFAYYRDYDTQMSFEAIAEKAFDEWNAGSGKECKEFLQNKCRSLSVGDIVHVNQIFMKCEPSGWKFVSPKYVSSFIDKVKNNPNYEKHPWKALQETVWQERMNNAV